MNLRIDKSGRIVVPKPLRERFGLKPHMELEVLERDDGMLLRPADRKPSMQQIDGLWVHQGTAAPDANWARVLEEVREQRLDELLKT